MSVKYKIKRFKDGNGTQHFSEWLKDLDINEKAFIYVQLDKATLGSLLLKPLGAGLYEIRSHAGSGYRVYCTVFGTILVLLSGGTKKKQNADITKASKLLKEFEGSYG